MKACVENGSENKELNAISEKVLGFNTKLTNFKLENTLAQ